jgi:NAD(P)-dependent dehydrogenase (short-subunit alcohol dehydrogenase family)
MRGVSMAKAALVTGGSKGIGFACARRLQQDGYAVMICARHQKELDEAVGQLRSTGDARCSVADVGHSEDCQRIVDECVQAFGRIDAVVNNAGIYHPVPLVDMTPEVWDRTFDVNLRGPMLVGAAAARYMREHGGGHIVNISSTNGVLSEPEFSHYNASKAAVISLTKTMALEWAPYHIQVNSIAPGWILTPLSEPWVADLTKQQLEDAFPMARVGRPEEIAEVAAFLCREGAEYLNGETIKVDGASLAVHPTI